MKIREGTSKHDVIYAIGMAGEFPFSSLYMLGDKITYQRAVRKLKEGGVLTVLGNAQNKTIRLTQKGVDLLYELNPILHEKYLITTNNHHFSSMNQKNKGGQTSYRRHRMAEVFCSMNHMGVFMYPDEKSEIVLTSNRDAIQDDSYVYYSSTELKHADARQRYKTEFTRILGALFSPGGVYATYNVNNGTIKWNSQGEQKAIVLLNHIIAANCSEGYMKTRKQKSAVLFAKNDDAILELLESRSKTKDSNGFELLSFDNVFDDMHVVTMDLPGYRQLNIMMGANWLNLIKTHLLNVPYEELSKSTIYDKYDIVTKSYSFLFFDCNINKIARFKMLMEDVPDANFVIYCYPWQTDLVRNIFSGDFSVETVEYEDMKSIISI